MSDTFIDAVLAGEAFWTDIDEWVRRWHAGEGTGELPEFLGMSGDEYAVWVEKPTALRAILAAHEYGKPFQRVIADSHEYALAARGLTADDLNAVREWLQETGRLPT